MLAGVKLHQLRPGLVSRRREIFFAGMDSRERLKMVVLIVGFLGIQENPGPKQSYLRRVRIHAHGANFYITGFARTATDFA